MGGTRKRVGAYLSLSLRWGGGGRLLNFSAFRMDVYLRWALILGWALIRINTASAAFISSFER